MALILHPDYQLYERKNKPFCSSLQVAQEFGKEHKNVLADIRSLGCSDDFNALNFQPVKYTVNDTWEAIGRGNEFAVMVDVGKKHGNGTAVRQLKWDSSILDVFDELRKED